MVGVAFQVQAAIGRCSRALPFMVVFHYHWSDLYRQELYIYECEGA